MRAKIRATILIARLTLRTRDSGGCGGSSGGVGAASGTPSVVAAPPAGASFRSISSPARISLQTSRLGGESPLHSLDVDPDTSFGRNVAGGLRLHAMAT